MVFNPIIGTLIYLLERKTNSVLLIKRDARPSDDHFGKYNGVGGKLEVDESVVQGALRELLEETGLTAASLRMRGTISWSNFGPRREEWLGFIFLVDQWEGDVFAENHEGTLEWVALDRLLAACDEDASVRQAADLPMWEGDRHFIPMVFDDDPSQFHGVMPYDGDSPLSWKFERI